MARRGIDSQFGMVDETTYGTPVTVTRFLEMRSADVSQEIETIVSEGLRAGRFNQARSGIYARWKKQATGTVEFDVQNKGFGLLLKHMLGGIATTGPVDTSAYTHTASVASLVGDYFTCQISRGVQPHTYHGCKVAEWEMSAEVGGLLALSVTIDAEEEDTSTGLATASYPTGLVPFSFLDGSLTVGGTTTHVRSFTLSGNNNLANERHFIRASGLKKEPIDQGREYTGEFELEYEDQTMYNRFLNATEAALVLTFTGGVISGASNYTLTINAPLIRFDGSTPGVDGPDIISMTAPFVVLDDSMTIAYKTTDATP